MAKSGSMKWCIVVVAMLVLFVHFRRQAARNNDLLPTPQAAPPAVDVSSLPAKVQPSPAMPIPAPRDSFADLSELETAFAQGDPSEVLVVGLPDFDEQEGQLAVVESNFDRGDQSMANPTRSADSELATKLPSPNMLHSVITPNRDVESKMADQAQRKPITRIELPRGVQIKVVHHIEYGKSLARRGAVYGAKQEFEAALRLVAQAVDNQLGTREFTERLYAAMLALKESEDFYYAQSESNGRVDMAAIGQRHQTKILTAEQFARMTPIDAMQAYYAFVQGNLTACSGHSVVAGEALYCLGKLYDMNSKNELEGNRLDNAKAIVFHGAALRCDPRNFKSANELGVLYAKSGRLDLAKQLMVQSLKIRQMPTLWENLAFVHHQLGETKLAQLAKDEYQRMLDGPPASQTARIQWVSPQQFASQSGEPAALRTAQLPVDPAPPAEPKSSPIKKAMNKLF